MSDKILRRSAFACLIMFGAFLLWAAFAPLSEGVTAFGKVSGDSDRQVVQHLEGGIIDEILTEEGASVEAGQPLIVLRDVSVTSGRDRIAIDQADVQASIARLRALASGGSFDLGDIDFSGVNETDRADIERRQRDLFQQQKRKLFADLDVLITRRAGLRDRVTNSQTEIAGVESQIAIVRSELSQKRELFAERLIARDEVTTLEREAAKLSAELGRLRAARSDAGAQANELSEQIVQLRADFAETVAADLVEENTRQSELNQRRTSLEDAVQRAVVTAPMAGSVLNLRYRTAGGVVKAGDPILEIVPEGEGLVATIEVQPSDIENVYEGLKVRARLAGLASWRSPTLEGQVVRVSADLKTSADGQYSFYEARVRMDGAERDQIDAAIVPGMPVEAFVESGRKRTLLDYIFEPIGTVIRRGARS